MKTAWAVIAEHYSDLTWRASAIRISAGENIAHTCQYNGDLRSLTLCESRKEAERIAADWNETWKTENCLATFQTLTVKGR